MKGVEHIDDLWRQRVYRSDVVLFALEPVLNLTQCAAPPTQAMVNAHVNIAPRYPAQRHDNHRVEGYLAIQGLRAEGGVEQDDQRSANAADHVGYQPEAHRAKAPCPAKVLANRIEKLKQHHRAANDSEPIGEVRSGIVYVAARHKYCGSTEQQRSDSNENPLD